MPSSLESSPIPPQTTHVIQPIPDLTQITSHVLVWQQYDPALKADVSSSALETDTGTFLIDPIPLPSDGLLRHLATSATGIFVTNVNHLRATLELANAFSIPIYANKGLSGIPDFPKANWVTDGEIFVPGLTAIEIEGGPAGETALHHQENGGTIVMGDALIDFEPHGFGLLPPKYCLNFKRMQRSLRKLLDYRFERILFAHGTPIVSDGFARLDRLLRDCGR